MAGPVPGPAHPASNSSGLNPRIASLGLPENSHHNGHPMIIGFKKKPASSLYFLGLIAVCAFIGFAAVQVSSKLFSEQRVTTAAKSMVHAPASISVHAIDGDTIGLNDGRANVRLVGFNAPETGSRARCEAERQKGEAAGRRLRELVAPAVRSSNRSLVLVRRGPKAPMRATSAAAAERCESMAWTLGQR